MHRAKLVRLFGLFGVVVSFVIFIQQPSFPTPDKLLIFGTFFAMLFNQGTQFLKRFVPFVVLLLAYESFRGIVPHLNTNVSYHLLPKIDRLMFFGQLPTTSLQNIFWNGQVHWYDFVFYLTYMLHFVLPFVLAVVVWKHRASEYWRVITTYMTVSFAGFLTFLAFPAAPPWMASDMGIIEPITRISSKIWYALGIHDFPSVYNKISPNPVAAMPSLHAAYATIFALFVMKLFKGSRWRYAAWIYPIIIYVGTVYSGEHYAIDEVAGAVYAVIGFWAAPYILGWMQVSYRKFIRSFKPHHHNDTKVVTIIGGGLSGLTTAYYLSKNKNVKVRVLESSGRLGGRLYTNYDHDEPLELGGFILFPWYKHLLKIISELDLDKDLYPLRCTEELFWNSEQQSYVYKGRIPLRRTLLFGLLKNPKLVFKLPVKNFYEPSLGSFSNKTVYDFIKGLDTKNTIATEISEQIVTSYCYGSITEIQASLYFGFLATFIRKGGFSKSLHIQGGIQYFIDTLESYLQQNNVDIVKNCIITKVSSTEIKSNTGTYATDLVVRADGMPTYLVPTDMARRQSYTNYYVAIVEVDRPIHKKWMAAYGALQPSDKPQIISAAPVNSVIGSVSDQRVMLCIRAKSTHKSKITATEMAKHIRAQLPFYFPTYNFTKIVILHHWPNTMPIATESFLLTVAKNQGQNNTYYVGDYFSTPCMETATYSGHKVAKLITETLL